ncbi:saccharopine dehydrogenase NADP-binding domain-containing protein [Nocardioidaceae bacterium]|nr:saccharopine dehydrogenase NADP-binding domain-containing protein [Nocardioidaceae bacterium]
MPDRAHPDRDYDVVLFGATGFTGQLTAAYLADHAPEGFRWALAGRSKEKLEKVRATLAEKHELAAELDLLVADVTDPASLRRVAESTGSVVTTVGPYLELGEPLVKACAEAGTDYLDITGEPEFVDRMYLEHHDKAVETGARLVHACGFDSIPHDLGALHNVLQLPDDEPVTMRGVVRAQGTFSGGTFASALTAMSRARQMQEVSRRRRSKEPAPAGGRRSRPKGTKPRRDSVLDLYLLPMPTLDPLVVARSGRAMPVYGPDFTYSHYAGIERLPVAVGGALGVTGLAAAAQLGPLRKFLIKRVPQGSGPSAERREKSWFTVDFIGEAADGTTVHTQVAGGDPGYEETSKMLAESALCLAFDPVPETSGQVTTAEAMGLQLVDRLDKAGITFSTL